MESLFRLCLRSRQVQLLHKGNAPVFESQYKNTFPFVSHENHDSLQSYLAETERIQKRERVEV